MELALLLLLAAAIPGNDQRPLITLPLPDMLLVDLNTTLLLLCWLLDVMEGKYVEVDFDGWL
jgi:hypothetical protein